MKKGQAEKTYGYVNRGYGSWRNDEYGRAKQGYGYESKGYGYENDPNEDGERDHGITRNKAYGYVNKGQGYENQDLYGNMKKAYGYLTRGYGAGLSNDPKDPLFHKPEVDHRADPPVELAQPAPAVQEVPPAE